MTLNWFTAVDVLIWLLAVLWLVTMLAPGYLANVCREAGDWFIGLVTARMRRDGEL